MKNKRVDHPATGGLGVFSTYFDDHVNQCKIDPRHSEIPGFFSMAASEVSGHLLLPCEKSCTSTINIARKNVILDAEIYMYIYVKMVLMLFMCTSCKNAVDRCKHACHTLFGVESELYYFITISGARVGAHVLRGTYATRCIIMFDRCHVHIKYTKYTK